MNWYNEPTPVNDLKGVDYILALDENGTDSMGNVDANHPERHWFTVTGVLINYKDFYSIRDDIIECKLRYWENGLFNNQRVVFHSRDIRKKQGAFNPRIINTEHFKSELEEIIRNMEVKIFSTNINKLNHKLKYCYPYPVYELGVEYLIERFCFEMKRNKAKGAILLESRGIREDKLVLEKIKKLINFGNEYSDKDTFDVISGVYFNKKRTCDQLQSYWPLEIADVVSYSIHNYVKNEEKDFIFESLEEKILGYPNYDGKGIKKFP